MEFRLPIGTFITIKEINYPILIIGHELAIKGGERYNYTGVLHPVGYSPDLDMMFFNHEDIENIIQIGIADFEHVTFSDLLDLEFGTEIYKDIELNKEKIEEDEINDDFIEL